MKKRIILGIIFCLSLISCNIPRAINIATKTHEYQLTDTGTTSQVDIGTSTIYIQVPSLTSEIVVFTETPSISQGFTATPEPGFGSISGNIYGYPYGIIPQLVIVAFEQLPPYHYWYVINTPGSSYYSMDGFISSGKYQVVGYDPGGHAGGCINIIEVKADEMITCDITNWGSGYPAKPAGAP